MSKERNNVNDLAGWILGIFKFSFFCGLATLGFFIGILISYFMR